jgi:ATP-binding cassette subfamily F protein 3
MLVMEDVDCGYRIESATDHSFTEKCIVSDVKFSLQIGQRIGLLGVNGAGKSTLIKTIVGDIPPLHGTMQTGKGLSIGYFAQHQVEMLRHDESPLWHLAHIAPDVREQELRNFLGGFNFPGTMVTSPIKPFSGGEKARLALAMIVWQRPNLLLLDEPTNHLDLETREALTDALAQFEGTLVVVSHDRHLLRATTDEFIIVADGKLQPFDGDLDDYKDWLFKNKLEKAATPAALPQKKRKKPACHSPNRFRLPRSMIRNSANVMPRNVSVWQMCASLSRHASNAWKTRWPSSIAKRKTSTCSSKTAISTATPTRKN